MTAGENDRAHLPALDGLRGAAILMVLVMHLSERFFFLANPWRRIAVLGYAGWTGVDLFFVLSGFLITGILWESRTSTHYFRNFYARRTLRLFPLYYITLIVIFVMLPTLLPLFHGGSFIERAIADRIMVLKATSAYWPWYFSYSADFLFAIGGFIFPAHFWTLAVEEHFYLVWPFVVHRVRHLNLIRVTTWIIIGTFILRCCLIKFLRPNGIYCLTFCRMDGLAMGAMIALVLRQENGLAILMSRVRYLFPVIAVLCCIEMLIERGCWSQYGFLQQTVGFTLAPALFACVLVKTLAEKRWAGALSSGVLRFLGKYSYGIYVIHPFVLDYSRHLFTLDCPGHFSIITDVLLKGHAAPRVAGVLDGACFVIVALGLSLLGALVSWRVIELPFLQMKRWFPYEKRVPSNGADLVLSAAEKSGAVSGAE